MAAKDQNLTIRIKGDSSSINKSFKEAKEVASEFGVEVVKVLNSVDAEGKKVAATMKLVGKSATVLNKAREALKREGLTEGSVTRKNFTTKAQDEAAEFQKRLNRVKRQDSIMLQRQANRLRLEEIALRTHTNSIEVFREKHRQKRIAEEERLESKLRGIRERYAAGRIDYSTQTRARNSAIAQFEATRSVQMRALAQANARETQQQQLVIAQNRQITEARRNQIRLAREAERLRERRLTQLRGASDLNRSILSHILGIVAGYRLANFALNKIKQVALAIPKSGIQQQATQAALAGVFGTEGAKDNLKFVQETADKMGQSITALEVGYRKFAPAAVLAGATQREVNQTFEDFAAIGTVLHKTPDEMQSVFLALEQMFAKGVVQSEELKKQLGNQLPAVVEIAARAMEKSPAQFMAAMKRNEITAKEFIPKFSKLYRAIYAGEGDEVLKTLSDKMFANYTRVLTSYENLNRKFFGKTESAMNIALKTTIKFIDTLGENLKGIAVVLSAVAVLLTGRVAAALISTTVSTLSLASANLFLTSTYMGLATASSTRQFIGFGELFRKASSYVGNFASRLTGLPPQLLLVTGAITGLVGIVAKLNDVTLGYGDIAEVSTKKQEELYRNNAVAIDELLKTTETTSDGIAKAREAAVDKANQDLKDLKAFQEVSNEFYITIQDNQIALVDFMSASWGLISDVGDIAFINLTDSIQRYAVDAIAGIAGLGSAFTEFRRQLDNISDGFDGAKLAKAMNEGVRKSLDESTIYLENYRSEQAKQRKIDIDKQVKEEQDKYTLLGTIAERADKLKDARFRKFQDKLAAERVQGVELTPIVETEASEVALAKYVDSNAAQLRALKANYDQNLVGIREYYAQKTKLEEEAFSRSVDVIDKQIAATESAQKKLKLQEDKRKLGDRLGARVTGNNAKMKEDLDKLTKSSDDAMVSLLKLQGRMVEAASLMAEAKYTEPLQKAMVNENQELVKTLGTIKTIEQAKGMSAQVSLNLASIEQQAAAKSTKIAEERFNYTISETEAQRKLLDVRKASINLQALEVSKLQTIVDSGAADLETTNQLIAAKNKLASERLAVAVANRKIQGDYLALAETSLTDNLANSFEGFINGTKSAAEAMSSFATSVIADLARIAAKDLAVKIIGGLFGSLGSSSGVSVANGNSEWFTKAINEPFKLASGGAASGLGSVSGSVLSSSTFFPQAKVIPLASGGVVAGEAGSEVVLPLKRGANGKLGVSSEGGSSSGVTIGNINVVLKEDKSMSSKEQSDMVGKAIAGQIKLAIKKEIGVSLRKGNVLNPTRIASVF